MLTLILDEGYLLNLTYTEWHEMTNIIYYNYSTSEYERMK